MCAITLWAYQLLDASDGKQARRTGNSSPLGLLFDHGCDALNGVLSGLTVAATLQMGATKWEAFGLVVVGGMTPFFFATWEEFYTGSLDLPGPINGPNEGLLVMYCIHAHAAIYGPSIWLSTDNPLGVANHTLFLLVTALCAIATVTSCNVLGVGRKIGTGIAGALLRDALPYFLLIALSIGWYILDPKYHEQNPRMATWIFGLLCCKLCMHVMLSHLCVEPMSLFRKSFVPLILIVAKTANDQQHFVDLPPLSLTEDHNRFVLGCFGIVLLSYIQMVYSVCSEMCAALGIKCFTVKPYKKEA
jgi:ethanolaminephosphotransferase